MKKTRTGAMAARALRRLGAASAASAACLAAMSTPVQAAESCNRDAAIERSDIIDMLAKTLLAFDDRDFGTFASNYTPDGFFTVYDVGTKQNLVKLAQADMVKFFTSQPKPTNESHHFTSNLTVDFQDATHATLHGYYMTVFNRGAVQPPQPVGMGSYDSRIVKVNCTWKFLEYKAVRSAGDPANLRKAEGATK